MRTKVPSSERARQADTARSLPGRLHVAFMSVSVAFRRFQTPVPPAHRSTTAYPPATSAPRPAVGSAENFFRRQPHPAPMNRCDLIRPRQNGRLKSQGEERSMRKGSWLLAVVCLSCLSWVVGAQQVAPDQRSKVEQGSPLALN